MKVYVVDYRKNGTINSTFFMRDKEGFEYAKHFFKQVEEMFGVDVVELHRGIVLKDGAIVRRSLIRSCEQSKREKKPTLIETVAKDPSEQTQDLLRKLEKEVRELKKASEQIQMQQHVDSEDDSLIFEKEEPKIDWKRIPRYNTSLERIS